MKLPIRSQAQFIYSSLTKWIVSCNDRENPCYSQMVDFGLTELVRMSMRSLAQVEGNWSEQKLLNRAIQQVKHQLQEQLSSQLAFELTPYWTGVRQRLQFPAREMAELAAQRQRTRQQEQTNRREQFFSVEQVPFEVIEVGRRGAIEALIAMPAVEEVIMTIDPNTALYQVEGEWFPFQVTAAELQVVIDDDGSIYVCTAHYPQTLMIQAREGLLWLADQIYRAN